MGQLEDMALFTRIVDTGSLTETADQMGIAKSAVSKRLNQLESKLGVQLLNRTTRTNSLTESGRQYYARAQSILSDVNDLTNSLQQERVELSGVLKLAVPLSFGLMHLAPAVNQFAKEHPDLRIDLNFADRQVDLVEEGFDLAIRIADLTDSTLVARRFTTIRHCLCASPAYLDKYGTLTHPEELRDHRILKYVSPSGATHHFRDSEGKSFEWTGTIAMSANNGDFLRQSAVEGLGMILLPTFIAWQDIKAGNLIPLLTDFQLTEFGAHAVYPQTRFLSARVRQFIDFLSDFFGSEPYWDKDLFQR